jgi:hypothetical protein
VYVLSANTTNRKVTVKMGRTCIKDGGRTNSTESFEAKAQGGRPVGRPRETWEEQVSIMIVGRGINWREARIVAQDRSRWRRLCKSLDTARQKKKKKKAVYVLNITFIIQSMKLLYLIFVTKICSYKLINRSTN